MGGVLINMAKNIVMQNLKLIKILKSSGKTDREIAKILDIKLSEFMKVLSEDDYIKEVYDNAQDKMISEVEAKFLEKVLEKLEEGETADAKWYLEKTSTKYTKKEQVSVTMQSIDDIVRGAGGDKSE